MRNVLYLALVGAVVAALAVAPRAEPAFPGANGEIAFSIVLPTSYAAAWLGDAQGIESVLCTIRPGGEARQKITAIDGNSVDGPAWSADGSWLALMGGAFPESPFVETVDGSGSPIYFPSGSSPAWAPGGDRIAYTSDEGRLAVVNLVGGQPQILAERGRQPAWSPDGTRVAYIVNDQLAVVGADGTGNVVLTSGPQTHSSPNWSPDGGRIVFVSQAGRDSLPAIELMNSDGSQRVQVASVRSPGFLVSVDPSWSPDGSKIAFVQWDDDSDSSDVYTVKPDGSDLTNLTRSPFSETTIDWRPLPAAGFLRAGQASCGVGGTSGADMLRGTPSDDVVYALTGNDRILTGGGFDIVLAGAGDDRVRLGPGEDDLAFGENGKDVLDGEDGPDGLFGGDGDDRLLGGGGSDELQGQGGKDVLVGGPGVDRLVGGPGDDRITPGRGRDEQVFGDAGNDTFFLRDGERDVVHCGKGRDEVQADRIDRVFRDCERELRR
jgi:Tol biopolymer transport system component